MANTVIDADDAGVASGHRQRAARAFVDGFGPALSIPAGLSVAGIVAARSRRGAPREVVPAGMRVAAAEAD